MDKALVNNQIILMRKIVKIVKKSLLRKIFKQINLLKKKIEKSNLKADVSEDLRKKYIENLNNKLQKKISNSKQLKLIKPDGVSKQALTHDFSHFDSLLKKSNQSIENHLIARICQHRLVQSSVRSFKNDNPGSEQWLPELISLWECKREARVKKIKNRKRKYDALTAKIKNGELLNSPSHPEFSNSKVKSDIKSDKSFENNIKKKSESVDSNLDLLKNSNKKSKLTKSPKKSLSSSKCPQFKVTPQFEETEMDTLISSNAVIKKLDLNSPETVEENFKSSATSETESNHSNENFKQLYKDNFFLNENDDEDDVKDLDDEDNKRNDYRKEKQNNYVKQNFKWNLVKQKKTKRYFNGHNNKSKGEYFDFCK
ncbi:Signal recognition particle protein [Sarcoptes scabiei]|nr:Signal recognition particle protein [Sarcoptes scabiei]